MLWPPRPTPPGTPLGSKVSSLLARTEPVQPTSAPSHPLRRRPGYASRDLLRLLDDTFAGEHGPRQTSRPACHLAHEVGHDLDDEDAPPDCARGNPLVPSRILSAPW